MGMVPLLAPSCRTAAQPILHNLVHCDRNSGPYPGVQLQQAAGKLTLTLSVGQTIPRLDVNGGGKPEHPMKINGDVNGDSGGWRL